MEQQVTERRVTVVTGGEPRHRRGRGAAAGRRPGTRSRIGYERAKDAAEEVAAQVRAAGAECLVHQVDTSDEEQVDAFFDAVRDGLGPVTGLVNNAGITGPLGRFAETPVEVMRRVVDVNVMGAMICARRAVQDMSTRYGGRGRRDRQHLLGRRHPGQPRRVRALRGEQGRGRRDDGGPVARSWPPRGCGSTRCCPG